MTKAIQVAQMGLSPVGSVDAYIRAVNQIPVLSSEEESELARQYHQEGNLEAAKKLVLAHLRYTVRIASTFLGYGLPLVDLIQEGNIGLMKAVKRFDPSVGVRLVSFAVHWIKSEIHEFIIRNWRIVKVATTKAQRKLFFNLRRSKKRLGWMTNKEVEQVAQDLNVSTKEVLTMEARMNGADIALESSGDDGDTDYNFGIIHYLASEQPGPLAQISAEQWRKRAHTKLAQALELLDDRSKAIIAKRWLNSENKMTLQELAQECGISLERVRQIEKSAIAKLRQVLQPLKEEFS